MRKILALCATMLLCCTGSACDIPETDPDSWNSCRDVGFALNTHVDECLEVVAKHIEIIQKDGDFFIKWEEFEICEVFGEAQGMRITPETLEELRACGRWLMDLTCDEVGMKLELIFFHNVKDVGQPPECGPAIERLRAKFKK